MCLLGIGKLDFIILPMPNFELKYKTYIDHSEQAVNRFHDLKQNIP